MNKLKSIVFLGASGAVGTATLNRLLQCSDLNKILLLGRKIIDVANSKIVDQKIINIENNSTYKEYIKDFDTAICTLGVGQPSKVSTEEFVRIDKTAVLDFAKVCKENNVKHFELLSSVAVSSASKNHFLRTKGELIDELELLQFERLSIFQPSMIITPTNRYGFSQAVILKLWPLLNVVLHGNLKKYRGIKVNELGTAIANNISTKGSGVEFLSYEQFKQLNNS